MLWTRPLPRTTATLLSLPSSSVPCSRPGPLDVIGRARRPAADGHRSTERGLVVPLATAAEALPTADRASFDIAIVKVTVADPGSAVRALASDCDC